MTSLLKRRLITAAFIIVPIVGYGFYNASEKRHNALMQEVYTAYDSCKALQVEEVDIFVDKEFDPDDLIWNSEKVDFKTWKRLSEDAQLARKRAKEDAIEREITINKAAWDCRDGVGKKYGKKAVSQSFGWKSHQTYAASKAAR